MIYENVLQAKGNSGDWVGNWTVEKCLKKAII